MSSPAETHTVPSFVGFLVHLVGVECQWYVGRSLKVSPKINKLAALLLLGLFFLPGWKYFPAMLRTSTVLDMHDWISGLTTLWILCMIAGACVAFVARRVPTPNEQRRNFLKVATGTVCAAPALALGTGIITRKDFHVKEIDLSFPNLPADLQGLRLLQLSDIHLGAFFTPRDLERVVDASNNLRPDLAFITGDLITGRYDPLDTCLRQLKRIRTHSGTWGCMGNHEKYSRLENYAEQQAQTLDIKFLRREAVRLRFGQSSLNLVGVDYETRAPYLVGVDELVDLDHFNLLLAHTPEVFPTAADKGFDLTLSGHTHGGQINLPIMGANINVADARTPYTKGHYTLPTSQIYVNSGLGTIGVPVRLGAPAEITLIRLCAS